MRGARPRAFEHDDPDPETRELRRDEEAQSTAEEDHVGLRRGPALGRGELLVGRAGREHPVEVLEPFDELRACALAQEISCRPRVHQAELSSGCGRQPAAPNERPRSTSLRESGTTARAVTES